MGRGLEAQENNSVKSPGGRPKQSPPSQSDKSDQLEANSNNSNSNINQKSKNKSNSTAAATQSSLQTENGEQAKPLGPPPRPAQNQSSSSNTPDIFGPQPAAGGSLSLEPNPFEQSFSNPSAETPGGTNKLPSVASLTSPGVQGGSQFNWGGGSLRTGPLSPAMLSGPTGDYFSEPHHLRSSFPTPNESSLRTGLTPGGGGSMFPAPSPGNGQSLYMPSTTPNTLEFQKTAMSAAAKRGQPQATQPPSSQPVTSQPQPNPSAASAIKLEAKPTGPFDNHDNDAANGLYMLAQGRNGSQVQQQSPMTAIAAATSRHPPLPAATMSSQPSVHTSPQMSNGGAVAPPAMPTHGVSEPASAASEDDDETHPSTRGKRKVGQPGTNTNGQGKGNNGSKYPNKKAKTSALASAGSMMLDDEDDSDSDDKHDQDDSSNKKLTDEEKRKNFLERNRVAALKCRQRKKQWLANLQAKVELYSQENDQLTVQITALREEIVNLKTLLLAHKDCPVTQQQGLGQAFMPPASNIDPGFSAVNPQMAPYGMAGGMSNQQQVMTAQPVDRRFA